MTLALPVLPRISDYLDLYAQRTPKASACWFEGVFTSYAELAQRVEALARAFLGLGLQHGDRVAVLSTPRPEFLVSMLAAVQVGLVWVGLNPRYTWRELAYVISDAQPRVLLSLTDFEGRDFSGMIARMRSEFEFIEHSFRLDGGPAVGALEDIALMQRVAEATLPAQHRAQRDAVQGGDAAVIVYTSGSSGSPKGAVLPHRSLVYGPGVEAEQTNIKQPRVLCNFPINHVACVGDTCCANLIAGGMLAFDERFDPAHYLVLVEKLRLTQLAHVPTVVQLVLEHLDFQTRDLSSLQLVAWGGAALPIDVVRAVRARGLRMLAVYGMTETVCNVTWADDSFSDEALATTIGKPDPNVELKLIDDNCVEVADGQEGEIAVRHGAMMLGYFNRPEATATAMTPDGFLRTGDIAQRLSDGSYRLVGRRSEMYKSGGYNIYPREIEQCLEEHPSVALAAVVGVPDPVYQEVGLAWLMRKPGAAALPDQVIRDWCRERLANYKIPKRFEWLDELPMLPVGKVDKLRLKRNSQEGTAAAQTATGGTAW